MNTIKIYTIVFCSLLIACQPESIDSQQSSENAFLETVSENTQNVTRGPQNPNQLPSDAELFENRMDWAAFIAGKVIFQSDTNFKNTLSGLLDLERRIPLGTLVGPNSIFPAFDHSFQNLLDEYVMGSISCPDSEEEDPDGVGIEQIFSAKMGITTVQDDFLDYLLVENCMEFYFPVAIKQGEANIHTVAYPLFTNPGSHSNEGFVRGDAVTVNCQITDVSWVLPNTISIYENSRTFIVARPVRVSFNSNCAYNEYAGINFADFLYGSW